MSNTSGYKSPIYQKDRGILIYNCSIIGGFSFGEKDFYLDIDIENSS